MQHFGKEIAKRRVANARVVQKAFGLVVADADLDSSATYRTIRSGGKITLFTVGYEKRSGEELISVLRDAGVQVLADIREKPFSRVPDFRAAALRASCEQAGIAYEGWQELGSTDQQRDRLKATGDFKAFETQFRKYAETHCADAIDRLAARTKGRVVALLCYERRHEECHRSIIADLMADRLNATIVAI